MDGIHLTKAEFPFEFAGQSYTVKTADLNQVILFKRKVKEITAEEDVGGDVRIFAYCLFLSLNAVDKNITEEYVLANCPGNLSNDEQMKVLIDLGFTSQPKAA